MIATEHFRDAERIACYVPLETEVNTWPIIQRAWELKKRIFAPIAEKARTLHFGQFGSESELSTGRMGLREPETGTRIDATLIDLVVVPLVAFDDDSNRIGMGGGYYDRTFSFLEDTPVGAKPILIGVAFDCQRVEKISPNPWDIRLFSVITEDSE